MGKPNVATIAKSIKVGLKRHSPGILTGVGIVGMISTTVVAVKSTPKALILLEEEKRRQNKERLENGDNRKVDKLKPMEVVKTTWKCYLPAAVTGAASVACLVGGSSVSARRNAALATAYTLSETAMKEYREKVVESIGERKETKVREAVAKERIEKNPPSKNTVIVTGKGDVLCYESISGRYFKSEMDKMKKAVNEANNRLLNHSYISLNEFYDELGLEYTKIGDHLGWNISQGLIDVHFSTQLSENDTPCIVLDYVDMPIYDFDKWL
jgi:hypothetical protein